METRNTIRINTEQPNPRQPFPVSVCLLVHPSIYQSICPSITLLLSISLSTYPPNCLSTYLPISLPVSLYLATYLSTYPPI